MKKRIIVAALLASMSLSLMGCSFGKTKFNEDKFASFVEDKFDADEVDKNKAEKLIEKQKKDSYYFSLDNKKDIKKLLWDGIEIEDYFGKPSKVESATCYVDVKTHNVEVDVILTFSSEKDAIKFMEDSLEAIEDEDAWTDTYDEDDVVIAACIEEDDFVFVLSAYRDKNAVLLLLADDQKGKYDFEHMEAICDKYKLELPEDLF